MGILGSGDPGLSELTIDSHRNTGPLSPLWCHTLWPVAHPLGPLVRWGLIVLLTKEDVRAQEIM